MRRRGVPQRQEVPLLRLLSSGTNNYILKKPKVAAT